MKLTIGNRSIELKWNSSLRFSHFLKLNGIQDEQAGEQLFSECVNIHKSFALKQLTSENATLGKVNESAVWKDGRFSKRITASATVAIGANELHLVDSWLEKKTDSHTKASEKVLMFKNAISGLDTTGLVLSDKEKSENALAKIENEKARAEQKKNADILARKLEAQKLEDEKLATIKLEAEKLALVLLEEKLKAIEAEKVKASAKK